MDHANHYPYPTIQYHSRNEYLSIGGGVTRGPDKQEKIDDRTNFILLINNNNILLLLFFVYTGGPIR